MGKSGWEWAVLFENGWCELKMGGKFRKRVRMFENAFLWSETAYGGCGHLKTRCGGWWRMYDNENGCQYSVTAADSCYLWKSLVDSWGQVLAVESGLGRLKMSNVNWRRVKRVRRGVNSREWLPLLKMSQWSSKMCVGNQIEVKMYTSKCYTAKTMKNRLRLNWNGQI